MLYPLLPNENPKKHTDSDPEQSPSEKSDDTNEHTTASPSQDLLSKNASDFQSPETVMYPKSAKMYSQSYNTSSNNSSFKS